MLQANLKKKYKKSHQIFSRKKRFVQQNHFISVAFYFSTFFFFFRSALCAC